MSKSIACAAALALLAGSACAQSTVTMYGKLDAGLRKAIGSTDKEIATGGDSRLGFRGTEDLGGGLSAFFGFEHRFFPDTGAVDGSQFWKGYSHVGLAGGFGRIGLGRQYIAAFSLAQNQLDPFGGDTVAQVRDVAVRVGGITKTRVDGSVRYDFSAAGVNLAVSVAESTKNGGPDRPLSIGINYRAGPLLLVAGSENPANATDKFWNVGAGYTFGAAQLTAGVSSGTMTTGVKAKGWMLGLNLPVGAGTVKAALGKQERGGATFAQKLGLGYHHALSKRTTVYTDFGRDSKAASNKTGYDLGLIHTF